MKTLLGCLGLLLLAGCMGKQARSAGAVGCGPDEIEISDERSHGLLVQSGETWVATCRGRTFVCTQINEAARNDGDGLVGLLASNSASNQVMCREEAETPQEEDNREARRLARLQQAIAPKAPSAPPQGAGGFDFGMSAADAQQRCEAAGHQWSTSGEELGHCSGTAMALGFAARATLRFCAGGVCGVTLELRPNGTWSQNVVSLKAKLEGKYGAAEAATRGIPSDCRSEDAFKRCLDSQKLELKYSWQWAGGEAVKMTVGKAATTDTSTIRLFYTGPTSRVDASAL